MASDARRHLPLVEALHARVDREAAGIAAAHGDRLHCREGCADCCSDDLTVFEVEADRIRAHAPGLLAGGAPHPPGACAFLDARGACRIYAVRPYVCRTQGLPLRWFEEDEDEEIVELRDICPLNAEGPALEEVEDEKCWLIGPTETALVELQEARGELRRVPLRALFARSSDPR